MDGPILRGVDTASSWPRAIRGRGTDACRSRYDTDGHSWSTRLLFRRRKVTIRAFGTPNTPFSVDPAAKRGRKITRLADGPFSCTTPRQKVSTGCTTFWGAGKGLLSRLNAPTRALRHTHESAMSSKTLRACRSLTTSPPVLYRHQRYTREILIELLPK